MLDLDALRERIEGLVARAGVAALALGIVSAGEVETLCFGADDGGSPVTPDTAFPTCSTGKILTGTAILRLVEQGALELDRPVASALPWLRYPRGADARQVTLRHLLSHTSGLSSDPAVPATLFEGDARCLERHVKSDVPTFRALPAGEVCWYSNPGFSIAGHLAESVTGKAFPKLVSELLFDPLGMESTSFDPDFEPKRGVVAYTSLVNGRRARLPVPYPAGGALSTLRDLCAFASSQMSGSGSSSESSSILSAETLAEMRRPHGDAFSGPPRRTGLACTVGVERGLARVAHGGGGSGCGTSFAMIPERRAAVVVLFNHPAGYGVDPARIFDALLELDSRSEARSEGEEPPADPDPGAWRERAGTYASPWPGSGVYPDSLEIEAGDRPRLHIEGETKPLERVDGSVYATPDGATTVGFVPGGRYLMFDGAGIGLVSAWPFTRAGS